LRHAHIEGAADHHDGPSQGDRVGKIIKKEDAEQQAPDKLGVLESGNARHGPQRKDWTRHICPNDISNPVMAIQPRSGHVGSI
jgi:hypothetical protein